MAQVKVYRILKPSVAQLERLTDVATRAYGDLKACRIMVGGNDALTPLQFRAMIRASALDGEIYAVENTAREILAFSIWFAPGKFLYATPEQRELGFNEFMDKLDSETQAWYEETYNPTVATWGSTWLPKPYPDCWWLAALATDPAYQGRGYGTLLMKDAIGKIPAPNIIGLVSTLEETAKFYAEVGIPVKSRLHPDMPSKLGDIPFFGHYREQSADELDS